MRRRSKPKIHIGDNGDDDEQKPAANEVRLLHQGTKFFWRSGTSIDYNVHETTDFVIVQASHSETSSAYPPVHLSRATIMTAASGGSKQDTPRSNTRKLANEHEDHRSFKLNREERKQLTSEILAKEKKKAAAQHLALLTSFVEKRLNFDDGGVKMEAAILQQNDIEKAIEKAQAAASEAPVVEATPHPINQIMDVVDKPELCSAKSTGVDSETSNGPGVEAPPLLQTALRAETGPSEEPIITSTDDSIEVQTAEVGARSSSVDKGQQPKQLGQPIVAGKLQKPEQPEQPEQLAKAAPPVEHSAWGRVFVKRQPSDPFTDEELFQQPKKASALPAIIFRRKSISMTHWNKMQSDFTVEEQATKHYRRASGTALAGVAIAMGVLARMLTDVRVQDETKAKKRWKKAVVKLQVDKTREFLAK